MIGFYNYTVIATFIGMISGIFGIFCSFAFPEEPILAILCLMFCGVIDMFDGKIAKTRKRTDAEKRFGIQIDSLSDLICFGVLPSCIGYAMGMRSIGFGLAMAAYTLAALIRLAYFNVTEEDRQKETDETRRLYEGLPVTSCALILPLTYIILHLCGAAPVVSAWVWTAVLLLMASAFLWKFHLRKPDLKGMMILLALGIVEVVVLFWVI